MIARLVTTPSAVNRWHTPTRRPGRPQRIRGWSGPSRARGPRAGGPWIHRRYDDRDEGGSHEALGERRQPARDGLHELEDQGPSSTSEPMAPVPDQRHEWHTVRITSASRISAASGRPPPIRRGCRARSAGRRGGRSGSSGAALDQGPQRDFDDRAEGPHRRVQVAEDALERVVGWRQLVGGCRRHERRERRSGRRCRGQG